MKFNLILILFLTKLAAQSDSLQYKIIELPSKPFVFRHQPGYRWYAIENSERKDSIEMNRVYSSFKEPYVRSVSIAFPLTTKLRDVTDILVKRNPSDTSLPATLKKSILLIGCTKSLDTTTYTNNTLAYDAAFLPFRTALRIGSSFNLENNHHIVSLYALGRISQEFDRGPWQFEEYSIRFSGSTRNLDNGNYHHEFSKTIWESEEAVLGYDEIPHVIWYGLLDGDEFPDFILNKGQHRKGHWLVLSSEAMK